MHLRATVICFYFGNKRFSITSRYSLSVDTQALRLFCYFVDKFDCSFIAAISLNFIKFHVKCNDSIYSALYAIPQYYKVCCKRNTTMTQFGTLDIYFDEKCHLPNKCSATDCMSPFQQQHRLTKTIFFVKIIYIITQI